MKARGVDIIVGMLPEATVQVPVPPAQSVCVAQQGSEILRKLAATQHLFKQDRLLLLHGDVT